MKTRSDDRGAVCPHCGHLHVNVLDWSSTEDFHICERCGRSFEFEREVYAIYHTRAASLCPHCNRMVAIKNNGTLKRHPVPGAWDDCKGSGEYARRDP